MTVDAHDALPALLAQAAAFHPELTDVDVLAPFLAVRLPEVLAAADPPARAADVVLAAACARGDRRAIAKLEGGFAATIEPVLARVGVAESDRPEVLQQIRAALLVGDAGRAPGIAGYRGAGDLASYVRAIAGKLALKFITRRAPGEGTARGDDALERLVATGDPLATALRTDSIDVLKTAMAEAIGALEPTRRLLLRQHYVDGVPTIDLSRVYAVHRVTITRWLGEARDVLMHELRDSLRRRGVPVDEIEELVGLAASQIDLSLSRLLA